MSASDSATTLVTTLTTDARGDFASDAGVPEGHYHLVAVADGFSLKYVGGVDVPHDGVEVAPIAMSVDGVDTEVDIVDEANRPVVASVKLARVSTDSGDVFTLKTDDHAHFRARLEKDRDYVATFSAADRSPERLLLPATEPSAHVVLRQLPPSATRNEAVCRLKQAAIRLSLDPELPQTQLSWAAFVQAMPSADIVFFGDATHGTSELITAKRDLFVELERARGFRIVMLEAGYPELLAIDNYVVSGKGDLPSLMTAMPAWLWDTDEVLEFLQWVRATNKKRPPKDRIHVLGCSVSSSPAAAEALGAILTKVSTEDGKRFDEDIAGFVAGGGLKYGSASEQVHRRTRQALEDAMSLLINNRQRFITVLGAETYEDAVELGELALEVEEALRLRPARFQAARDTVMGHIVERTRKRFPGVGIMVWAHNSHVSKDKSGRGADTLGSATVRAFPRNVYVIGSVLHSGKFQAKDLKGDGHLREFPLPEPPPDSLAPLLQDVLPEPFVVNLRSLDEATTGYLFKPIASSQYGATATEGAPPKVTLMPAKHFDALVYLPVTKASRLRSASGTHQSL